MNSKRIEEIQKETAYPDSVSVQQALGKVWNETQQAADEEITKLKEENRRLKEDLEDIEERYDDMCERT